MLITIIMSFKELPLMEPKDGTVLFYPYISKSSFAEVKKVLSGRWIGQGPLVDKFEKNLKICLLKKTIVLLLVQERMHFI